MHAVADSTSLLYSHSFLCKCKYKSLARLVLLAVCFSPLLEQRTKKLSQYMGHFCAELLLQPAASSSASVWIKPHIIRCLLDPTWCLSSVSYLVWVARGCVCLSVTQGTTVGELESSPSPSPVVQARRPHQP